MLRTITTALGLVAFTCSATLLTILGTLRSVQEGSVQVLSRELNGASNAELVAARRDIGFIFQAHNLFESLTALQNVRMGMELFNFTEQEMQERAYFSDFRTVDGLVIPHRIEREYGARHTVTKVEKVRLNPELEDGVFAMPAQSE